MKRILYAEDDDDTREILTLFLQHQGWEVVAAKDGREALRAYHSQPAGVFFDVILLDIQMPRLNGIAVGVNIRNLENFSEEIPRARHIYLTAQDEPEEREQLLKIHFADAYLVKPVEPEDLLKALNG